MDIVPNDEAEPCDLCSEGTGMNDGVGWKIVMCPMHAAAPALLDALREMLGVPTMLQRAQSIVSMCDALRTDTGLDEADELQCDIDKIVCKARAAIAKATGQQ